jgi:hypothetical protein
MTVKVLIERQRPDPPVFMISAYGDTGTVARMSAR